MEILSLRYNWTNSAIIQIMWIWYNFFNLYYFCYCSPAFLFQYVGYARKYVHPKLSPEAGSVIQVHIFFVQWITNVSRVLVAIDSKTIISDYRASRGKGQPGSGDSFWPVSSPHFGWLTHCPTQVPTPGLRPVKLPHYAAHPHMDSTKNRFCYFFYSSSKLMLTLVYIYCIVFHVESLQNKNTSLCTYSWHKNDL